MKKILIGIVITVLGGLILAIILHYFQGASVEYMDLGHGIEVWNKTGSPVEVNLTIYWRENDGQKQETHRETLHGSMFVPNRHGPGAEYVLNVTGGGKVHISAQGTFRSSR
ncbi:hypothetical protein JXJ21_10780 [candidate division KSB1 bacterium]|nr:hypothetical protein [candidate division KSB1 bacterium]